MTALVPEQIQDLPWATLDDLLDAKEDIEAWGFCCARLVDDDGVMRMKRIGPVPDDQTYTTRSEGGAAIARHKEAR